MKFAIAAFPLALLLATAPALVQAQVNHAAKNTVKKRGGKVVPKTVEEKTPIDDDPAVVLTDADLLVAKQVLTGDIPCELGATVHITPHKREGFFIVRTGIQRFRMHPVESKTGAIRLEDPVAGAMWLQLSNKSMLMSQKMGKRLADDCMNPAQMAVNEGLKKNPINILEPAPVKVVAPAVAVESPAAIAGTAASPPATPASAVPPPAPAAPETPSPAAAPAGTAPAAPVVPAVPAATTN
ncbi:hypothetical protein ACFPOE_14890 [Caenimonas terrae]|uniref:Uncharacterized protein n=1 Tax=Caenimonas terrae TaxID=696074 RepID=A0ABW0NHR1_9BURK